MINISSFVPSFHSIPVICGPTASGKSSLSLTVCRQIQGELFSMDSMQIYQGMDIGTAKATNEEQQEIPHHLINLIEPCESFSPIQYLEVAYREVDRCLNRGHLPVFCGGTGQYASALAKGIDFIPIDIQPDVRDQLQKEATENGIDILYQELVASDPEAAKRIHPNNQKRVLRALEIYRQTGKTMTYFNEQSTKNGPKYPFSIFAISIDREILYRRIDTRVEEMIESGLLQEVEVLLSKRTPVSQTSMQAIGYKELIQYLQGHCSLQDAIDEIKKNTRHYAKRQMTWFSHMENVTWICPDESRKIIDSIRSC